MNREHWQAEYERATLANVGWFQMQIALPYLPQKQADDILQYLSDVALLGEKADRTRRLLGLVMAGDLPAAQALAKQWISDAAHSYAESDWERSQGL